MYSGHAVYAWKATQVIIPLRFVASLINFISLDYVRAVAYAGGRLFSAGDDKTVSVSAILQTCSHHLVLQVRMWETVHHDCIRVLTGIPCARCAGFVLMIVVRCAGHTGYINALLAARGRIYSAGNDKTIRVWE